MSDIFREVDEEVRREQLKRLWDRYGLLMVVAAVLVLVATGAWRGYQWYAAKKVAETSAAYEAAMQLAQGGKHAEAAAAFAQLAEKGTSSYRSLSRLREGEELAFQDANGAVAAFDAVAANAANPQLQRDLAAIRAGFVLIDRAPFADVGRRLEPLAQSNHNPFRHTARELLALAAWRSGDMAAARRWGEAALADQGAPANLRARVDTLMALIGDNAKSS